MRNFLSIVAAFAAFFFSFLAFGQAEAPKPDLGILEMLLNFLLPFIKSNPIFASILLFVGFFRLIFKPLMTFLEAIANATTTPKDNEILDAFKKSYVYGLIVFILDWFGSIKPSSVKRAFGGK